MVASKGRSSHGFRWYGQVCASLTDVIQKSLVGCSTGWEQMMGKCWTAACRAAVAQEWIISTPGGEYPPLAALGGGGQSAGAGRSSWSYLSPSSSSCCWWKTSRGGVRGAEQRAPGGREEVEITLYWIQWGRSWNKWRWICVSMRRESDFLIAQHFRLFDSVFFQKASILPFLAILRKGKHWSFALSLMPPIRWSDKK